jgi:Ca2+-binding EF-hand superfamily protein
LEVVNASGYEGEMDFKAFLDVFGFSQQASSEMSLKNLFERFDYHHQGFFGCEELDRVSSEVGCNISLP